VLVMRKHRPFFERASEVSSVKKGHDRTSGKKKGGPDAKGRGLTPEGRLRQTCKGDGENRKRRAALETSGKTGSQNYKKGRPSTKEKKRPACQGEKGAAFIGPPCSCLDQRERRGISSSLREEKGEGDESKSDQKKKKTPEGQR